MNDLNDRAVHLLAVLLVEREDSWAIAPDARDGARRCEPANYVLDEGPAGRVNDQLAEAIRAEQRRMKSQPSR